MTTLDIPKSIARAIDNYWRNDGASTTCFIKGVNDPTSGYIVSLPSHEEIVSGIATSNNFYEAVTDYVSRKRAILAETNRYLGIWYDNGYIYFDISTRFAEKDDALIAGENYGQIAIYDVTAKEVITLR
jgi:hypothetical protein